MPSILLCTLCVLFNLLIPSNKYYYYSHLSDEETDFAQFSLKFCEKGLNILPADNKLRAQVKCCKVILLKSVKPRLEHLSSKSVFFHHFAQSSCVTNKGDSEVGLRKRGSQSASTRSPLNMTICWIIRVGMYWCREDTIIYKIHVSVLMRWLVSVVGNI